MKDSMSLIVSTCSGLWDKGITRATCVVLLLLPPLHEHFPHTDTSEIRHVNRPWLRLYKRWPQQHTEHNRTIHFILLIHCLAHLPFDNCIHSPQQYQYLDHPGRSVDVPGQIRAAFPDAQV
jgi:hypothetical protein